MAMLIIPHVSRVCAHTLRTKLNGFDKQQMASKAKNAAALGKFAEFLNSSKFRPVFTSVCIKVSGPQLGFSFSSILRVSLKLCCG